MCNTCDDNRFKLIEKYKTQLVEATNIADDPKEMDVIDRILFRFWQIGWLDKLEKPVPQWIPCSERLPETEVLCCDTRGEMIIGYAYCDEESNTGFSAEEDGVFLIDCIAWMPLPEPYKGEQT